MNYQILHGDCLDRLKEIEPNTIDAIVTDPPYGFGFMGKTWDASTPAREVFDECLAVLKPGGYLLAFGGARTYHRERYRERESLRRGYGQSTRYQQEVA